MKNTTHKKRNPKTRKPVKNQAGIIKNNEDLFIVGLGASAGGLQALKLFFDNTQVNSKIAYVIVQHLEPTHKSHLVELLTKHTKMKVREITNGLKVMPAEVYIIPSNADLKIFNGKLQLTKPKEQRHLRRLIDSFFVSLAEDQKEKAIGILFSGTGTDGTLGLKAIREKYGYTMVQDPTTAQFVGMPNSAIKAKAVDLILPPNEMPEKVLRFIRRMKVPKLDRQFSDLEANETQLKKIFQLIRNHSGYDFSNYKTSTILRRISKRALLLHCNSIDDYLVLLQSNPTEIEDLYADFFIGVTSFFRDKAVFKSIEQKAIPNLFEKCSEKQEVRVWVCGCSTGEEAYSLAILFKEAMEKRKQFTKVMIFASDIDKKAIDFARMGIYSESALSDVPSQYRLKYFIKKQNTYQLKKEIREMVVFAYHNLIKDPPFSKMDLITCRNMLIYMNTDLQKRIIPVFHYSLSDNGILILGTSESLGDFGSNFSEFDSKNKIYKKNSLNIARKPKTEFDLTGILKNQYLSFKKQTSVKSKKVNVSDLSEKILLNNYTPPSVLIDKSNNALYFSGNVGWFLELARGEATLNIVAMAKKSLKQYLVKAIKNARQTKEEVYEKNIDMIIDNHNKRLDIIAKPVTSGDTEPGTMMLVFEVSENEQKKGRDKKHTVKNKKELAASALERELQITKQHLQTAISELETSNEDLQTTNEEYQSSNEELQSTNEELETSREELQSVNEELITVNNELTGKIDLLSQANDDLNNLLTSIEVATVFLDRDLKIKRFTPTATKIFNLIPSDIERPVTHLSSNIVYRGLVDDIKNALKTLAVKSADVQAVDGSWYQMRILPYRTAENVIEGVLVTFIEITEQKKTEEKLNKTNEQLNLIMENLPAVPFTCNIEPQINFSFVGKSCEKVMGFSAEQFITNNLFWSSRVHPDDKKAIQAAFANVSKKGSFELPFRWKCSDGKYKSFINYLRYTPAENNQPEYIVGVWQELPSNTQKAKSKK